jgi:hypothetical protein
MKTLKPSAKTAHVAKMIPETTLEQKLIGFDEDFRLLKNF